MERSTVLVLGAGTGGIITAKALSKMAGKKARIILIEKEAENVFAPSLLWLMVGKRKPEQVFRNTKEIADANIEIVIGKIESINPTDISVMVKGQSYKGDFMVISLGVEQAAEHNLDKIGYNFYTLRGAADFYENLKKFKGGQIDIVVPSLPFKCPAAPYEAAMLIEAYIRNKGIRNTTEISLYTPEAGPMGVAGKEISDAVKQLLEAKGIKYFPEHLLIDASERRLTFNNAKSVQFDLLAYTPKHQCPSILNNNPLVGESGWIDVQRNTLETGFKNVYAIGDVATIPLEFGKPLPKAGVFAHFQAETVAFNITQKITGTILKNTFNGEGQCFLETGNGMAGYAGGNFYGSPLPMIKMRKPGYFWHWAKVWVEKYWFYKNF